VSGVQKVQSSKFKVQGSRFKVQGSRLRTLGKTLLNKPGVAVPGFSGAKFFAGKRRW
jgi:hypothetical protein